MASRASQRQLLPLPHPLLLLLLTSAPRPAAPQPQLMPAGCSLAPLVGGWFSSGKDPGTCFLEPGEASNHDKRLIPAGPADCTGKLSPGVTPTPLPPGTTCDKTRMSPELCAATCLKAFEGKPESIVGIGTEFAQECYCAVSHDLDALGSMTPVGAVLGAGCDMKCPGAPDTICGGSNYISVWRLECGAWGYRFLLLRRLARTFSPCTRRVANQTLLQCWSAAYSMPVAASPTTGRSRARRV